MYSYCGVWTASWVDLVGFAGEADIPGGTLAQVSITWVPWVLMALMDWSLLRGTATPERAGMLWIVPGAYFETGKVTMIQALEKWVPADGLSDPSLQTFITSIPL